MKIIAKNQRAGFDFELLERFEAGIQLTGQEVKSVKTGHLSLKGSFVTVHGNELFLTNAFIPPYTFAGQLPAYDPTRPRKLLLHRHEIRSLIGKMRTEGLTAVPICVYTKRQHLKLEFALAKGKKKHDKRDAIGRQDAKRRIERALKQG